MLGLAQLEKLLDQHRYGTAIDRCLEAGGFVPLQIRLAIETEEHATCGATALALSRSLELTRLVTPFAERLASELLAHKTEEGLFERDGMPFATILSVAALGSFVQVSERTQCERTRGSRSNALLAEAEDAVRGAIDRLRTDAAISENGLVGDASTTAFLLVCGARVPGLLDDGFVTSMTEALLANGAMHDRHTSRMLRHALSLLGACSVSRPTPAAA